jgi:hypothetical protein
MDFVRFFRLTNAGAYFVTRAKNKLQLNRGYSLPANRLTGLRNDHVGRPCLAKSRSAFPVLLRKVRHYDSETERDLIFLTNKFRRSR